MFLESDIFKLAQQESKNSYKIYRYVQAYLMYKYKNSNLTINDIFQYTGGNNKWKHDNNFVEKFWNKFPEYFPPYSLEKWMMELYNIEISELNNVLKFDIKEFNKYLLLQDAPKYYVEYHLVAFSKKLPLGLSIKEAIEFVNNIPYEDIIKARGIQTQLYSVNFSKDRSFFVNYFKPSLEIKDNSVIFNSYTR